MAAKKASRPPLRQVTLRREAFAKGGTVMAAKRASRPPLRQVTLRREAFAKGMARVAGLALLSAMAAALLVGCAAAAAPTPAPQAAPGNNPGGSEVAAPVPTEAPALSAKGSGGDAPPTAAIPESNVRPILATKLLRVGSQRVSFLLEGPKAIIKAPEATVTTTFLGDDAVPGETKQARFHIWPYKVRGAYSAELTFDRPGQWRLDITAVEGDFTAQGSAVVEVTREAGIPDIGSIPPGSETKTLGTVDSIEELTTDYTPDPELYRVSVADAIADPKPAVVAFASPAFCTSPTCGPQVDTVSELRAAHPDRANYIHVEIYANPQEIQGDLSKATLAEAVHEWGLTGLDEWLNESWTFVLNPEGRIAHKFEGFVTLVELEEALQQVLTEG